MRWFNDAAYVDFDDAAWNRDDRGDRRRSPDDHGISRASVIPDNLQRLGYAVGAEFRPSRWSRHRSVTEIRAQEVDIAADGRYILRLSLWPFHEFAIEFDGFNLETEPVAERGPTRAGSFVLRGIDDD